MNNIIYHDVLDVTEEGIILESAKDKIFIDFDDCVKNFYSEKGAEFGKCVATRDITTLSFVFYTSPKTTVIFKKNFLQDLLAKKSAVSKFYDLQKEIAKVGYTSYDLS